MNNCLLRKLRKNL